MYSVIFQSAGANTTDHSTISDRWQPPPPPTLMLQVCGAMASKHVTCLYLLTSHSTHTHSPSSCLTHGWRHKCSECVVRSHFPFQQERCSSISSDRPAESDRTTFTANANKSADFTLMKTAFSWAKHVNILPQLPSSSHPLSHTVRGLLVSSRVKC